MGRTDPRQHRLAFGAAEGVHDEARNRIELALNHLAGNGWPVDGYFAELVKWIFATTAKIGKPVSRSYGELAVILRTSPATVKRRANLAVQAGLLIATPHYIGTGTQTGNYWSINWDGLAEILTRRRRGLCYRARDSPPVQGDQGAGQGDQGAGQGDQQNSSRISLLAPNPPPPSSSQVSGRPPETGLPPTWENAEEELQRIGVKEIRESIDAAKCNGCLPQHVIDVVIEGERFDAWDDLAKAVRRKLDFHKPDHDPTNLKFWPKVSPAYLVREQQAAAQRAAERKQKLDQEAAEERRRAKNDAAKRDALLATVPKERQAAIAESLAAANEMLRSRWRDKGLESEFVRNAVAAVVREEMQCPITATPPVA